MAYSNPPNQVRIRDSGTVRQLNIPRENLEELQKIVSSRHKTDEFKKQMIKKLAVFVAPWRLVILRVALPGLNVIAASV